MAIGRRSFVAGVGAGLLIGGAGARFALAATAPTFADHPFSLGVASGEPEADGVVLWTRLAPRPFQPDGGMPPMAVSVRWEVAEDEGFKRIAARGEQLASPDLAHSVHVEVKGLRSARVYWYRFTVGGETSPVGRTRTAPAKGAEVERLKLCFASCQNWEAGHYAAYRHLVAEDPDLVLFLGDYIYEGDPRSGGVRRHQNPEPKDLAAYRFRYATYKSDPLLQAAHHAAPWAVTWDDHEVENDYAGAIDEMNDDPAPFLLRRAAAYQAYYEHMPLRAAARPTGSAMRLYRALDWGSLAQLQIVDDRQYRGERACQPPELAAGRKHYLNPVPECAQRHDPARSILGKTQEAWLSQTLAGSKAKWNLLSQQTLMSPLKRIDGAHPERPASLYGIDGWEGFPANRERIVTRWREAKVSNPVVLGGDIHAFVAVDMMDVRDPKSPVVAAEFVGSSISSSGDDGYNRNSAQNAGYHFTEGRVRGYGLLTATKDRCDVAFRGLADVKNPDSAIANLKTFTVESGRPGVQDG